MFKLLLIGALILYYWLFYHFTSKPFRVPSTLAPLKPDPAKIAFNVLAHNHFQFTLNAILMWDHAFLEDRYQVHGPTNTIIERDDCFHYTLPTNIRAAGLSLYTFLKKHSQYDSLFTFQENSPYDVQTHGDVFYYTCKNRHIDALHMCPSGERFQNGHCVAISHCTGKPNATKLPYHPDVTKYIECTNNREFVKSCPPGMLFYHDACIAKVNILFYCQYHDTKLPIFLNPSYMFECRDHQPIYTQCPSQTRFMPGSLECEPEACLGKADHEKVALPLITVGPLSFSPGYLHCLHEKVLETVECPSEWDPQLSKGDDLTTLPMVFDGQQCDIPTFCENVHASDPDIIIPVHEFTKQVPNWKFSKYLDTGMGYVCEQGVRKRQRVDPDQRISKRFKREPTCGPQDPPFLPIYQAPHQYYNCPLQTVVSCQHTEFFNGTQCEPIPENAFQYQNVPFFNFDALNDEGWIAPFESYSVKPVPYACQSADYTFLKLHHICVHKDCEDYTFLSMIPELSLFLPRPQASRCRMDMSDGHLKKEPVDHGYSFWNQRTLTENVNRVEECTEGQKINTGHFVWDSTIFATCQDVQPFVFCPSVHTHQLIREGDVWACEPPASTRKRHTLTANTHPNEFWPYPTNEFKRIISTGPSTTHFYLNRADKNVYRLFANDVFDIPVNTRIALKTNQPVELEIRNRVTYPTHAAFHYDDQNNRIMKTGAKHSAFYMSNEKFVTYALNFPKYTPKVHVVDFDL